MLYIAAFVTGYAVTLSVLYAIDLSNPDLLNRWMRVEDRVIELIRKEQG